MIDSCDNDEFHETIKHNNDDVNGETVDNGIGIEKSNGYLKNTDTLKHTVGSTTSIALFYL